MKYVVFLVLISVVLCNIYHKRFAILMTGTTDQYNGGYRHQSDVAHAFHLFKNAGVPVENILLITPNNTILPDAMWFLFNWPSCNSTDLRPGLAINSTFEAGLDVFNQQAKDAFSLKYFETYKPYPEPNDSIFIYVVGHGQPGIWSFGGEYWYADDILGMLRNLTIRWPYVDVVLIVETCYAASVFENELFANNHTFYYNGTYIPHRITVIAASQSNEASFAYFCDETILYVYHIDSLSCIADEFSYQWMWFLEHYNMSESTVGAMANFTIRQTFNSHPLVIGNPRNLNMTLDLFIGPDKPRVVRVQEDPIYCFCDAPNIEDVVEMHGECQGFLYRNGSWYTNFPPPTGIPYVSGVPLYTNTPAPTRSPPIPLPNNYTQQKLQSVVDYDNEEEEDDDEDEEDEMEYTNNHIIKKSNNGNNGNNGNKYETLEEKRRKALKEYAERRMTAEQRHLHDRLPAFIAAHGDEFNLRNVPKEKHKLKTLELLSRTMEGKFRTPWQRKYEDELDLETRIDTFFQRFNKTVDLSRPVTKVENWDCYKQAIARFDKRFGKSSYGFSQFHLLATMCNQKKNIYKKI